MGFNAIDGYTKLQCVMHVMGVAIDNDAWCGAKSLSWSGSWSKIQLIAAFSGVRNLPCDTAAFANLSTSSASLMFCCVCIPGILKKYCPLWAGQRVGEAADGEVGEIEYGDSSHVESWRDGTDSG